LSIAVIFSLARPSIRAVFACALADGKGTFSYGGIIADYRYRVKQKPNADTTARGPPLHICDVLRRIFAALRQAGGLNGFLFL